MLKVFQATGINTENQTHIKLFRKQRSESQGKIVWFSDFTHEFLSRESKNCSFSPPYLVKTVPPLMIIVPNQVNDGGMN